MPGSWSLRPEHVRLQGGGEGSGSGRSAGGGTSIRGAATRIELKAGGGDKLLVSQANIDGAAAAQRPANGANGAGVMVAVGDDPLESGG